MADEITPPAAPAPQPVVPQMQIELPVNLEAVYSNFVLITHAPSEVIIDFARLLPNTPKTRVHARVLMTPLHAKLLLRALADNLAKYEAQFGEIQIPTGLADQLFKPKE
jgi:hypothetical protein